MHTVAEIMQLPCGAEVLDANEHRIGKRGLGSSQLLLREFGASHAHADVTGYSVDGAIVSAQPKVCGVSLTELSKPGVEQYVQAAIRSAVLQCSGDAEYVAAVAAHRERITKLQRQEAHAEYIHNEMAKNAKKRAHAV